MRASFSSVVCLLLLVAQPALARENKSSEAEGSSAHAVIREMNLARQTPALYATFIQELRSKMSGNVLVLPGHTRIRTKEGTAALDEAIQFLRTAQPQAPLTLSPGMCRAAADHCADQQLVGSGMKAGIAAMPAIGSHVTERSRADGAKIFPTAN